MTGAGSIWFGRYEELGSIGAGGMAHVILARDLLLGRRVVLKLLRTPEPALIQRLRIEARITARCHHANVVVIYECGEHNGLPYMVLEYLCGRPLTTLMDSAGRLPYPRAVEILVPVLQALQHVHEAGIVHRDLKPDNIFLTESGATKLLDFGIAKVLEHAPPQLRKSGQSYLRNPSEWVMTSSSKLTRVGTILGTLPYMSPEQWGIGIEVDHLTDIWACGVLLFQLICGCHPLAPRHGKLVLAL